MRALQAASIVVCGQDKRRQHQGANRICDVDTINPLCSRFRQPRNRGAQHAGVDIMKLKLPLIKTYVYRYTVYMAKDRTITARMRRYRSKKREAGFVRRDILLSPEEGRVLALQKRISQLVDGGGAFQRALVTINVPRPKPINAATFLQALIEPEQEQWRPHVEAFFTEVAPETIHDIVLGGIVDFPLLAASQKLWNLEQAPHADWIREMARERLAAAA
ncbi:hypothetical protein [Ferrovibrio sp.]|uniref:hypothetical protein n=1 Tax=Ferrovibrio sp. TaxID=1917215 RepID=UPI001B6506F2|nr:hypothetical protein [Ferrovibrio sp.]MBP7065363.1 hypothetical protein [Ferrovibrio sp.]